MRYVYKWMTLPITVLALGSTGCGADSEPDETALASDPSEHFSQAPAGFPAFTSVPVSPHEAKSVIPDQLDDETIPKGLIQQTEQSNAELFSWSTPGVDAWGSPAYRADVHMHSRDTHLCVLTRVSGNFDGNSIVAVHKSTQDIDFRCRNSLIGMVVDDSDPVWKLGGCQPDARNSLAAEATCVPGSNFLVDPGGIIVYSATSTVRVVRPSLTHCSSSASIDIGAAGDIGFLQGIMGYFNGGGEKAEIIPGTANSAMKLSVGTQSCSEDGHVEGLSNSFFAGLSNRGTIRGQLISVSAQSDQHNKVKLARTRDSLCYLTKISGALNGAGERLRIFPEKDATGTEWWMFEAKAQGGKVYGTAQCVQYDQRTGPVLL